MTLYTDKVLAIQLGNLIGYWQLSESGGLTAIDVSGQANHGVYLNVTLGQSGIGDGNTAAGFNGTNSAADVFSSGLFSDFDPAEGTLAFWVRVSGSGVWTDGTQRMIGVFTGSSLDNYLAIVKTTTNNQLQFIYRANAVQQDVFSTVAGGITAWFHVAMTWSSSADEVKCYINGIQVGTTQNGLDIWNAAFNGALLGAYSGPSQVWSGNLAHSPLWSAPLAPAEIFELSSVPPTAAAISAPRVCEPLLRITDGTTIVDLLSKGYGLHLFDWTPNIFSGKGGGVFADSPLADGRQLVDRKFENAIDTLELKVNGHSQDGTILSMRNLRGLLEQGVNYWLADWQVNPVYIEARGPGETNTRYAVIVDYRVPQDDNPYATPFFGSDAMDDITVVLEHGPWLDNPPGTDECIEISGHTGDVVHNKTVSIAASANDATVDETLASIDTASGYLYIGKVSGNENNSGFRFTNVNIPKGATIISAVLSVYSYGTTSGTVKYRMEGEDADTSAAFSTYANFMARARTTEFKNSQIIQSWSYGTKYSLSGAQDIVQEIIDRPGWLIGSEITLFLMDNGTDSSFRRMASYDHPTFPAPQLFVSYTMPMYGQEATCNDGEVYIANKFNIASLTHAWRYDASGPSYTSILGAGLPVLLLPAVPAVGDIIYFGIDSSTVDSGPFCSLVFNLSQVQSGVAGGWEYYQGAPTSNWSALFPQDNTDTFATLGINSVHWEQKKDSTNGDWATTAINGITGWFVRFRVTGISSPTPPVQETREIYTVTWPHIDIADAQTGGDISTLIRANILGRSTTANIFGQGSTINNHLPASRCLIGARSLARSNGFSMFINLADEQNAGGVNDVASASGYATFINDITTPTGRALQFDAPVTTLLTDHQFLNVWLYGSVYTGSYHMFVRAKQVAGVLGQLTFKTKVWNTGPYIGAVTYFTSEVQTPHILATSTTSYWELFDLGVINIPASPAMWTKDDTLTTVSVTFFASSANVASPGDLVFMDLILLPIDEWSGDFRSYNGYKLTVGSALSDRVLVAESSRSMRTSLRSFIGDSGDRDGNYPDVFCQSISAGPFTIQPSSAQQLSFLFATQDSNETYWLSYPEVSQSVWLHGVKRYFSMRGGR